MKKLYLSVAAGALIAGLIAMPAQALDVGVGGNSSGGTTGSASEGSTSGSATIGGTNNVGSATVNSGGNQGTVNIGNTSGPLVTGTQTGSPVDDNSNTDADVNLGALGGLLGSIPGGGGGGITPGAVATAVSGMGGGQMAQLKLTCNSVLSAPARYDAGMVQLCRLLLAL